jgi:hypothetical protein
VLCIASPALALSTGARVGRDAKGPNTRKPPLSPAKTVRRLTCNRRNLPMSTEAYTTPALSGNTLHFAPPVVAFDAGRDWAHWIVRLTPAALPVAVYPGPNGLDCVRCEARTCAHRLAVVTSGFAPAEPTFARPVTDEDVDELLTPRPRPTDELRAGLDALVTLQAQFETALFCSRIGAEIRADVLRAARCATKHADAIRVD